MQPVSGRWDAAIRGGGRVISYVEAWRSGSRVTLPDGSTQLPVAGGKLVVDESSKVRRVLDLDVSDASLFSILDPLGNETRCELRAFSGVQMAEGDIEVVPVFTGHITSVTRPVFLSGLKVNAGDYSRTLAGDRFIDGWNTPYGAIVPVEIARMATDSMPGLTVVDLTGSYAGTTPNSWRPERWDAMSNLAAGIGAEVFFDPEGRLIIRPVPQVTDSTVPVWTIDASTSTAVMNDYQLSSSTEGIYNAVKVSSSAQDIAVSATVYQSAGPARWRKSTPTDPGFTQPRFFASPVIKTLEGAVSAGYSILAKSSAFALSVDPRSAPNPALEVGDAISVDPPDRSAETRILSRFELALEGGVMPMRTRVGIDADFTSDAGTLS